jgi:carbonic anhydrase/acetyltransferase-like protein (isoleucine patch superfamily)
MSRGTLVRLLIPVYLVLIVGVPAAVAALPVLTAPALWQRVLAVALAPVIYGVAYVLVAGLLGRLTVRAIVPGKFPRDLGHAVYGPRRLYGLCWTAVYYCGPVYHAVLALPWLKRLTFRLFGYRGSLKFTTYPDTWIRDLPLLDVAEDAYLSNKATIGTNICRPDGSIVVGPVRIGRRAMVGHLAMLGPGCVIEDGVEIGVGAAIGLDVRVGAGSRIGPTAAIDHGATVGARCSVGAGAYVGKKAVIEDGVTVPPGFSVRGRAVVRSAADIAKMTVIHRRTMELMVSERPPEPLADRVPPDESRSIVLAVDARLPSVRPTRVAAMSPALDVLHPHGPFE